MKTRVIDFHTHIFPEKIVDRAIFTLEKNSGEKAFHDGRLSSLLKSMDNAGIARSVIANIATKPDQFHSILTWSQEIRSERIIPFLSVHPLDPLMVEHVRITKEEGFKGIKMHPYYQEFTLDNETMYPLYAALIKYDLILLSHTGFDIAYPRTRICDPEKIAHVKNIFPELTFVASHCGAWEDWEEVEKYLLGKKIFLELSFAFTTLPPEKRDKFLTKHPSDYLLFGTDSPWTDQFAAYRGIESIEMSAERKGKILYKNAESLLKL